jgi:gamma-glutamyl:cysteine ligase YbdK (ATP-grasp superfamily)
MIHIDISAHSTVKPQPQPLTTEQRERYTVSLPFSTMYPMTCKTHPIRPASTTRQAASGYRGVTKYRSRFIAQTTVNGKHIHLGVFDTPEEAARAWDRKMRELYGDGRTVQLFDEVQDT